MNAKQLEDRNNYLTLAVDKLGKVRADIAELKELEKLLKDQLEAAGVEAHEGFLFRATVSTACRKVTDWKAIALKLKASRQMIKGNTKIKEVTTVRTSSRTGKAA